MRRMAARSREEKTHMAQVDYFLKIEGIPGESADKKHSGEIDVESWSWGETNSGNFAYGGGGGAGKVSMQDFHFVARMSKASPNLFSYCATGKHVKEATLTCRKAGGKQEEFLTVKMESVLVSSYQTGGSGASDIIPMDQVSLNFAKITFEYKEQAADGSVKGSVKQSYDQKQNVAV
jgi:type VI secretion system secreted protein Hcp